MTTPRAFRTDYDPYLDPGDDRPTRAEADADELDDYPMRYRAGEVTRIDDMGDLDARIVALQDAINARRSG